MMKEWLLKKDNVNDLCMEASRKWETYVPLEEIGGDVQFAKLNGKGRKQSLEKPRLCAQGRGKLNLDYEWLVIPPKVIAFPQLESLFQFQQGKIRETVASPKKKLLFGLRACDVKGILFVNDFFKRNFEDVYYLNRAMDSLLVIVGCKRPMKNCFCTSTKTGPFLQAGFDLQMVDVDDAYVVEVGSQKGEEFINTYKKFFNKASKEVVAQSKKAKRQAEEAISLKVDFEGSIRKICKHKIPKEIYERIGERCIYCGGCLYVCPTCTCFHVFDDKKGDWGRRWRNWDGCVFEGYTREASGHNPRQEKWLRTSRRYEHKLKYDYLTTGMSGCVGCGRCLTSCPVSIGISKFIQEITEERKIM